MLVDERCRASDPDVYAAGDVANHLHPLFGRVRVEHYNNAEKHGRAAARSMLGDEAPYDYIHSFWSDQYEHDLEYVGHAQTWDEFVVRGRIERSDEAWVEALRSSGPSASQLHTRSTVPRNGFETAITVPAGKLLTADS